MWTPPAHLLAVMDHVPARSSDRHNDRYHWPASMIKGWLSADYLAAHPGEGREADQRTNCPKWTK